MRVVVNGDHLDLEDGSSIAALLERLQIGRERVAVEANLEIVPKAAYDGHTLSEGDTIEIVHFVGGG
jgi:sulfur carrier protein